jgi:hypothetical protein
MISRAHIRPTIQNHNVGTIRIGRRGTFWRYTQEDVKQINLESDSLRRLVIFKR